MDTFIDTSFLIPAIIESPDSNLVRDFIETSLNRLIVSPLIYQESLHVGEKYCFTNGLELNLLLQPENTYGKTDIMTFQIS